MTFKNIKTLNFYKELPFNIYGSLTAAVDQIKKWDPLIVYPELNKIISNYKKTKIVDFGCGGGWLVNSMSYHHKDKVEITGIDFNPKVIEYANKIKNLCNLNSKFFTSDIFEFKSSEKFDLVISLGVLHHTNNCHEAIRHISSFSDQNSYLFLGLYHKYGREPFLNYFKNMKNQSDDYKFKEYKKLHKNITDEKKMYSWFRDQVLHPHETQHTFEEISTLLIKLGYSIKSTSINKFDNINDLKDIYELEKECYEISIKKIQDNEYYPGFFIITGKK